MAHPCWPEQGVTPGMHTAPGQQLTSDNTAPVLQLNGDNPRDLAPHASHLRAHTSYLAASLAAVFKCANGGRKDRNSLAPPNSMRPVKGQPEVQTAWTSYLLSSPFRVLEKPIRGRQARRILSLSHHRPCPWPPIVSKATVAWLLPRVFQRG